MYCTHYPRRGDSEKGAEDRLLLVIVLDKLDHGGVWAWEAVIAFLPSLWRADSRGCRR